MLSVSTLGSAVSSLPGVSTLGPAGTTNCLTSSCGGRFDFGIGIKSRVQLSGRKWEEGCSENSFFLDLESFSAGLELFTVVGFLVVVAVDLVAGIGVVDDDDDDGTVVVVVSSN